MVGEELVFVEKSYNWVPHTMELGEEITVKALRERFLNNESSLIQMKPAIPEKPKMSPFINPTAKISNPLIASINSAVENRLAPRVVYRIDKKTQPSSQPKTPEVKARPILLDEKQKKEADLIKQALKDKMILPISPVKPDFQSNIESVRKSPGLETLVKIPTPVKTVQDEKEKTQLPEWDAPASSFLESSNTTKAKAERYYKPVVPKALVPPVRPNPIISALAHTSPGGSPSKSPALMVPEPAPRNGPQTEHQRPAIPVRLNSNARNSKLDIFSNGLPEDVESPDYLDIYIPPPIIPEDFTEGGIFQDSPSITPEPSFPQAFLSLSPVPRSPAQFRTAPPIQPIENPDSNSVFTFSPPPANLSSLLPVESVVEKKVTESPKANGNMENLLEVPIPSSPMAASVASALARAEEMAPVKYNTCDKRLLNLLEKSKRKSATPENLPIFETDLSSNFSHESLPLEAAYDRPVSHVAVQNAPKTLVNLSDIPPVDYEGKMEKTATAEFNALPYETTVNNHESFHSVGVSAAPKTVVVQKPLVPPPPPPRKPQLAVPNGDLTPEKLPPTASENRKSTVLPSLPLEYKEPIFKDPANFTLDDTTFSHPSERAGSQNDAPENPRRSVHEQVFFDHFDLKHQTPNIDSTDPEYSDSALNSVFGSALPSPTGKQNNYSVDTVDSATSKKTKAQKKQRRGSPMNPYADTSVVTDEIPKKALFSGLESNDQELKLKQKQKDKEKEKDKKEQKEKKKEQREKEREKKELKEKEKKENEIKKKFRITGEEEALYQAKVRETMKGRKDDLAIKAGEIVSIIRTTDCPKGKWLARDSSNKFGYIPVESVELNIEEMMAMGNKAHRPNINGVISSRTSSANMIMNQESFEDDSEEWGDDDDDTVFPTVPATNMVLNERSSNIDSNAGPSHPAHTDNSDNVHAGREVIHKLTTFFAQPTVPLVQNNTPIKEPEPFAVSAQEPGNFLKEEVNLHILPPPDIYADIVVG